MQKISIDQKPGQFILGLDYYPAFMKKNKKILYMSICDFPWTKRYSWNVAGWTWISRCDNIAFRPPGSSSSSAVHHVVRALRGCKIPPLGQLESKSGVWICNAFPLERAGWWWTEPLVFIYETSIDTKYILKSEWGTPCSHSPYCDHLFFDIIPEGKFFS